MTEEQLYSAKRFADFLLKFKDRIISQDEEGIYYFGDDGEVKILEADETFFQKNEEIVRNRLDDIKDLDHSDGVMNACMNEEAAKLNNEIVNLEAAKVADLQKKAREAARAFEHPATWIAGASKQALIAYITNPEAGPAKAEVKSVGINLDTLKQIINEAVEARMKSVEGMAVNRIEVKINPTGEIKKLGVQHKDFAKLLRFVSIGLQNPDKQLNIWLTGPAGSGKTTAAANVAKALGLRFYCNGAIDTEYKLKGFCDATGKIVSTQFREAWLNGGVYLFDEVDASMPSACLALNSALANGVVDFPDGLMARHPQCIVLASGNVWGGATEEYVGRFKPDAAFSDRFIRLRWDYDEQLERSLAGNDEWVDFVQGCRKRAKARGIKVVISPRASMNGAMLLKGGETWNEVVESTVRKGMTDDMWRQISQD